VGAYDLPEYEWGTASSPIVYGDKVIVQCDQQKGSFLEALNRDTGRTLWKAERDELPSWGTPAVYRSTARTELVTNGSNFVRGYDPSTGKELWRLGGSSKITAPTPVFGDGLIVVASGRRPEAPIFAIRAGAAGDITGDTRWVAWQKQQRGSYMPTPLIYGGYLYVLGNAGVFDCYSLATGAEIYRERIPHQGSGFSGSPVASDGKIYLPSEDGDIFVVKAGPHFELLQKNERQVCYLGYEGLPLAMAIAFALERSRPRRKLSSVMAAFAVAAAGGFLAYNFYPAVGPVHVFGPRFPYLPPPAGMPPFGLVAVGPEARNAMPSVHIAMALLILWNSRPWPGVYRALAGALLAITVLATLGFGEHYLVDVFVAVPFALLAQGLASTGVPWRNVTRRACVAAGAISVLAWLTYLRLPSPPFEGRGGLAWTLLSATAAASVLLESRLCRVVACAGAPALPRVNEGEYAERLPAPG